MAKYVRWLAVKTAARDEGEVCQFVIFLDRFSCNVRLDRPAPVIRQMSVLSSPVAGCERSAGALVRLHQADAGSLRRIKRPGKRWRDGILTTELASITEHKTCSMLRRQSHISVNHQPLRQVWDTRRMVYRLTAAFTRLRSPMRHILDAVLKQAE
jgi:hypothetical protein